MTIPKCSLSIIEHTAGINIQMDTILRHAFANQGLPSSEEEWTAHDMTVVEFLNCCALAKQNPTKVLEQAELLYKAKMNSSWSGYMADNKYTIIELRIHDQTVVYDAYGIDGKMVVPSTPISDERLIRHYTKDTAVNAILNLGGIGADLLASEQAYATDLEFIRRYLPACHVYFGLGTSEYRIAI
jgi:hypothetical protein